jgi:hypothetical protein
MSSQGRHFIKNVRGQAVASSTQRNRIRLPSIEQAMEYEDSSIDVHRYPSHVKADEPKQRGRPQPKRVGIKARDRKD